MSFRSCRCSLLSWRLRDVLITLLPATLSASRTMLSTAARPLVLTSPSIGQVGRSLAQSPFLSFHCLMSG
eukprot:3934553-Rhodomonas_salina.1